MFLSFLKRKNPVQEASTAVMYVSELNKVAGLTSREEGYLRSHGKRWLRDNLSPFTFRVEIFLFGENANTGKIPK
jgi:hypothetical protein